MRTLKMKFDEPIKVKIWRIHKYAKHPVDFNDVREIELIFDE